MTYKPAVSPDDEATDQSTEARVEQAEVIEAIREGLAAAERGEMKPAEQVFDEMRARYRLPG
jgi:predicted transcriptional regulator